MTKEEVLDEEGFFILPINKSFSLWECYENDETVPAYVAVDTNMNGRMEYADIPKVIEFLQLVYKERVLNAKT